MKVRKHEKKIKNNFLRYYVFSATALEKKLQKIIVLLLIVGAVFNRELYGLIYTCKCSFTRGFGCQEVEMLDPEP